MLHFPRHVTARITILALMPALLTACSGTGAGGPTIALSPANDPPRVLIMRGLSEQTLNSLAALEPEQRQRLLQVWVANAPPGAAVPPLSGDVTRRGTNLVFVPRYLFQPGVRYRARFDPTVLSSTAATTEAAINTEFMIPAPSPDPVVKVAAIYPSSDELPENLLRFYIHFSGPMSRGDAYAHVHLLNESGQVVPFPFLELGEELWNSEMTRFTLFFDPGRIKQGLVPRMELGPALESGKTYTLVVDAAWQDGEHRPLVEPARKKFRARPVDSVQPDPARWCITAPPAGSTRALVIRFDEPLDHALLQRVLSIRDAAGRAVDGKVSIAGHEQEWSFTPKTPWQPGRHVVAVETILEDAAGNSIGRPFEVNLNQGAKPTAPAQVEIPFDIRQGN